MEFASKNNQTSEIESRIIRAPNGQLDSILKRLKFIAEKNASVLFLGPTGTGKELLADYLVENSSREKAPYNKINCIGLPGEIIDSELFGHKKGAFTGAISDHVGLIESSNGGTLFLDEIGVLPEEIQAKLLRVLEDKKIRKIGDASLWKEVDVRFVAATNKTDLNIDIKHRFEFLIEVPPLNKRREDIPYLLEHFLKDSPFKSIDLLALFQYCILDWKGNLREFKRALRDTELNLEIALTRGDISQDDPSAFVFKMIYLSDYFNESDDLLQNPIWISSNAYRDLCWHTNFEVLLSQEFPEVIPYQETIQHWAHEDSISLVELHLKLDKQFTEIATKLVYKYAPLLSKENYEILQKLIYHPNDEGILRVNGRVVWENDSYSGWFWWWKEWCQDDPSYRPWRSPRIEAKTKEEKGEAPLNAAKKKEMEKTPVDLYDLPLKLAQKEFRKRYWKEIHRKNLNLNKKQLAKEMGISETRYHKMKQEFSYD